MYYYCNACASRRAEAARAASSTSRSIYNYLSIYIFIYITRIQQFHNKGHSLVVGGSLDLTHPAARPGCREGAAAPGHRCQCWGCPPSRPGLQGGQVNLRGSRPSTRPWRGQQVLNASLWGRWCWGRRTHRGSLEKGLQVCMGRGETARGMGEWGLWGVGGKARWPWG